MRTFCDEVNRSAWSPGPWDNEPEDRVEWECEGYPCTIRRNDNMGAWCGYVWLPLVNHPWSRKHYSEIDADIHGGLTYSEHVDLRWVVGFDFSDEQDRAPWPSYAPSGKLFGGGEHYGTRDEAIAETEKLARQARGAEESAA